MLQDNNEIVTKIYSAKQGKKETIRSYNRRLKELLKKMETQLMDELKKRWFLSIELISKKKNDNGTTDVI